MNAGNGGGTAIKAYQGTKKAEKEISSGVFVEGLISAAIGVTVFTMVQSVMDKITGDNIWGAKVWVASPTGLTIKELPLRLAIRIIRKRDWEFAEVEPIRLRGDVV